MANEAETKKIIQEALENHNFQICDITLNGSTEKSDGYVSRITFATVKVITQNSLEEQLGIVVKSSKEMSLEIFKCMYKRESYLYKVIIPELNKFQLESNVKNIFDSVPLCYKVISNKFMEVIVIKNMKKIGYCLYDHKKPLNLDHLKLILREHGKLHALSFAFRQKRKSDFDKLVYCLDEVLIKTVNGSFGKWMQHNLDKICCTLKSIGENELYEMCNKILQTGVTTALTDMLTIGELESAILHGDSWNNNFMFKYETEDRKCPSKVAIVDWQLSSLHSPVFDLSYFIYSNSSDEQLQHFDELLNVYYTSFSALLIQLSCDPEKLYPFSTLLKHWKKYALYGVIVVITLLPLFICDNEDAPNFNEIHTEQDVFEEMKNIRIADEIEYRKRLVAVLKHYYKFYSAQM